MLPEHKQQPLALYADAGRKGQRIVACCRAAVLCGIAAGMPLAEARGLVGTGRHRQPEPLFTAHNPEEDQAALCRLAVWCQRFSPTVGVEGADCLLLDVTGCAHLWSGEQQLCREFSRAVGRWGLTVRTAIADTIGAAWAVAHFGEEQATVVPPGQQEAAVSPLPVLALRLPASVTGRLDELAVRGIGQLRKLPRASLSSRFGSEVARRLDQALGNIPEQIEPVRLTEPVEAGREFEHPTGDRQSLETVLAQLVEQVTGQLRELQQGVQQLQIHFHHSGHEDTQFTVGTLRPVSAADHLMELVRTRLEQVELTEEVSGIRLGITGAALMESRQNRLFDSGNDTNGQREFDRLVDRLSSRLGEQCVVCPELLPDAQPELAVRWVPVSAAKGRSRAQRSQAQAHRLPRTWSAAARPLFLRTEPLPVEVTSVVPDGPPIRFFLNDHLQTVARWWGPERIETGWWRARPIRRDYYRVEIETGQRFWLYRQIAHGSWFLHGEFE